MEDTAPADATFRSHSGKESSQWPVRAETTDVLYAGCEYETLDAAVAVPHSPGPRGAVAAWPVMGLDHQHLAPATGKQGTRRQSGNAGAYHHDMVMIFIARPTAE